MDVRTVEHPPSLGRLFAKAAVSGIAGAVGGGGGSDALPDTQVVLEAASIDRDRLATYDRVCGFRLGDRLPATYPHLLAFPLSLDIMARRDFPFALPGLVHIANRITQRRRIDASEPLTVRVHCEDLRAHAKGQQFDVVSEVTVAGESVWSEVSTYLHRGKGGSEPAAGSEQPEVVALSASGQWRLDGSIGRSYAAVSGDRNPIHLHPLTAKAFGFPRQIAHGMWTKARCLAALEGRLPDAFEVDVSFKKPVLLPGTVVFSSARNGDDWDFALGSTTDLPHLRGRIRAM